MDSLHNQYILPLIQINVNAFQIRVVYKRKLHNL